jgi:rhomboid family protein
VIPLRDTIPSRRLPFVNLTLIAVNVVCFVYELSQGHHAHRLIETFGLVPARLIRLPPVGLITLVTSAFLHSGWLHLLGNMLSLYIFGDNVEDRLGHLRYLVFYLLSGVAAGLAQAYTAPHSIIPMIGASGAIAGVCGAYFVFFPTARVVTLVPIFFFFQIIEIPAVVFLLLWFLMQVFYGLATVSVAGREVGGIAFWAHAGGFVFGMLAGPLLSRRRDRRFVLP